MADARAGFAGLGRPAPCPWDEGRTCRRRLGWLIGVDPEGLGHIGTVGQRRLPQRSGSGAATPWPAPGSRARPLSDVACASTPPLPAAAIDWPGSTPSGVGLLAAFACTMTPQPPLDVPSPWPTGSSGDQPTPTFLPCGHGSNLLPTVKGPPELDLGPPPRSRALLVDPEVPVGGAVLASTTDSPGSRRADRRPGYPASPPARLAQGPRPRRGARR